MIDLGIQFAVLTFLAIFFAGSALHKLTHFSSFRLAITGYGIMPAALVPTAAAIAASAEVLVVVLALLPGYQPVAALLGASLFLGYACLMMVAILRGNAGADCGCNWGNSRQSTPLGRPLIYRNLVLALITLIAVATPDIRSLVWLDWVTALLASAAIILLYQAFNALIATLAFQQEHSS
ncbi:hypothetical protein GCM10017044_00720 [Kordiimonas sediminis]|uniref:Methylamine utilization protein MauE n=1 Tax=Kordiimonas sediminis TaxID=1735581 RepID=A0A919E494_9PROT|nr:MauE/DoxX family redox-associated membrane protein [Kordiimonas sediminis]GHF10894.1 hypothetical protein GCM10017044_00720 [Kordiimonas sediminis]